MKQPECLPPLLRPSPAPHLKYECGRECVFKRTVSSSPLSKLNNFGPSLSAFAFSRGTHLTLALAFCSLSCASASPKSQAFHLILLDRTDSFRCSIYYTILTIAFVIAFRTKWRGREAVGWNRNHEWSTCWYVRYAVGENEPVESLQCPVPTAARTLARARRETLIFSLGTGWRVFCLCAQLFWPGLQRSRDMES